MTDSPKSQHSVAEIFRLYLDDYKRGHKLSYEQNRAAHDILVCRTPALGGVLKLCSEKCGHWEFLFKSCKNRHCPLCGSFEKAQWLEAQGKLKRMTLPAVEFIGRFVAHVLPSRFVRIRHFGLHHGSSRRKLQAARQLLGLPRQLPVIQKLRLLEWLKQILKTDTDPRLCPACGKGIMIPCRELGPVSGWREHLLPLLGLFERWKFAMP